MKKALLLIAIISLITACGKKPENIAELTSPIAYAMVKNAIGQDTSHGKLKIDVNYDNLKMEKSGWPSGEIKFQVEMGEYPGKIAKIQYILDGSFIASAIVEMPGQDKKQVKVNLYENAIIFGQTQTVENKILDISSKLSQGIKPNSKVAVFDFVGIQKENTILGKRISESLITHLSNNKIMVVERKLLDPVFKEMNFQDTGLTNQDLMIKIGNFLGADTIVAGTIKNENEEILINARAIDLKSGVIISSAQVIFPRYLVNKNDLQVIGDNNIFKNIK